MGRRARVPTRHSSSDVLPCCSGRCHFEIGEADADCLARFELDDENHAVPVEHEMGQPKLHRHDAGGAVGVYGRLHYGSRQRPNAQRLIFGAILAATIYAAYRSRRRAKFPRRRGPGGDGDRAPDANSTENKRRWRPCGADGRSTKNGGGGVGEAGEGPSGGGGENDRNSEPKTRRQENNNICEAKNPELTGTFGGGGGGGGRGEDGRGDGGEGAKACDESSLHAEDAFEESDVHAEGACEESGLRVEGEEGFNPAAKSWEPGGPATAPCRSPRHDRGHPTDVVDADGMQGDEARARVPARGKDGHRKRDSSAVKVKKEPQKLGAVSSGGGGGGVGDDGGRQKDEDGGDVPTSSNGTRSDLLKSKTHSFVSESSTEELLAEVDGLIEDATAACARARARPSDHASRNGVGKYQAPRRSRTTAGGETTRRPGDTHHRPKRPRPRRGVSGAEVDALVRLTRRVLWGDPDALREIVEDAFLRERGGDGGGGGGSGGSEPIGELAESALVVLGTTSAAAAIHGLAPTGSASGHDVLRQHTAPLHKF